MRHHWFYYLAGTITLLSGLGFLLISLLPTAPTQANYQTAPAEAIYTRYFESVDTELTQLYQLYSLTAIKGEKITIVVYALDEDLSPAISLLNPVGVTLVENLNPANEPVAVVEAFADVTGTFPFIVSRTTPQVGRVRVMVFEGDPIDQSVAILDTVDPFLPSRAYLISGERQAGSTTIPVEMAIESRPFSDAAPDDPLPAFFASRADQFAPAPLAERLNPVQSIFWQNEAGETFYTLNIRGVPELLPASEIVAVGTPVPTLEQALLPYDIVVSVRVGDEEPPEPQRLERPVCSLTYSLVARTLVVQDEPGEAFQRIGQISGGDTVEIIGTDDTGGWIQIVYPASITGTGWVQNLDLFDTSGAGCQRVVPVEESASGLNEAIEAILNRLPTTVAVLPTPTPTEFVPTIEPTIPPTPPLLTKTVDNENPGEGTEVNFTITVTNTSTVAYENVIVSDALPAELTYVRVSGCLGDGYPFCTLGTIPAGGSASYILTAQVQTVPEPRRVTNTATLTIGGQTVQAFADVNLPVPQSPPPPTYIDLAITKTASSLQVTEQQVITFTLTASNPGSVGVQDAAVNDALPAGLTYVSHSGGNYDPGTGVWSIGTLDAGATVTLQLNVSVNVGAYPSTITNVAAMTSALPDSNNANDSASVTIRVVCVNGGIAVAAGDVAGLIAAINTANSNGDTTAICLVNSTYGVAGVNNSTNGDNGLPSITTPITIIGNNAVIARTGATIYRLFHVGGAGNLTLNQVVVQGGRETEGGGIYSLGTLTVNGGTLQSNTATTNGGGIFTGGNLTINGTAIRSNATTGFFSAGGGIYASAGNVTINSGTVIGGNGTGNTTAYGGGIYTLAAATLDVNGATISYNTANFAGGGIVSYGPVDVNGSTISDNLSREYGGGFAISAGSVVNITGSTIANNRANVGGSRDGGGILSQGANVTISNSTMTGNTAGNNGGAIYNDNGSTFNFTSVNFGSNSPNNCFTNGTVNYINGGGNTGGDTSCGGF